jgi:hypothetical protein
MNESFDADVFMRGFEWAKWSDCRDMVECAYAEGQKGVTEKERDRIINALMKIHSETAGWHNYYLWLANELKEGRL